MSVYDTVETLVENGIYFFKNIHPTKEGVTEWAEMIVTELELSNCKELSEYVSGCIQYHIDCRLIIK